MVEGAEGGVDARVRDTSENSVKVITTCLMDICDETFAEGNAIHLTLPEGITSIGAGAFYGECKC